MKNKITGNIRQVQTNFCTKEAWFKVKSGKDLNCKNCLTPYTKTEGDYVGLMIVEGQLNPHVCAKCAEYFKSTGAEDIDAKRQINKERKDELVAKILSFGNFNLKDLTELKIDELEKILEVKSEKYKKELELQKAIKNEFLETETEQYLIDDYSIVEFEDLKHESEIEEYFKDCGYEYFNCGQGYYSDGVDVLLKIGNKFYQVELYAEIGSAKQDRGERLYWVESIRMVKWKQIDKPLPKPKNYSIDISEMNIDQYNLVKKVLIESKIKFRG